MPFNLELPLDLKTQGWKVKIREKERVEPPHVSILRKQATWRWGLREQSFLDKQPPPKSVPKELVEYLQTNITTLIAAWDRMYPYNPVAMQDKE